MGFGRVPFVSRGQGLPQPLSPGDGMVSNFAIDTIVGDEVATLTVAQVSGGAIHVSGTLTTDALLTMPLGVDLAAAFPGMNIGDSYAFVVTNANTAVFSVVLVLNTGVVIVGEAEVIRHASRTMILKKVTDVTFTLH